jgi:hypothetical protein
MVVRLLGLVLGLLGLLVGLVCPLLGALRPLVGLLGLVLRLLRLRLRQLQLVQRLLGLALGPLGLVLGLPRLDLRLLGSAPGLLCTLPCVVGILLGHASLVFHSLQVALQLTDRQVNQSALVLVALALVSCLIGGRARTRPCQEHSGIVGPVWVNSAGSRAMWAVTGTLCGSRWVR